jgi:outer membrane receptor protein involved in Fe transport
MRRLTPLLLLLGVVALSGAVAVSALELDGSIAGTVKDSQGSPLPGVSVTVASPVLQGTRTAVTKNDGSYSLVKLPPGAGYRLTFVLSGFKTVELTSLQVFVGKETPASARLDLAPVSAEVTVTSERPTVDPTQTNTQQNFTGDYLKKLPVGAAGRSYQGILNQAPGVAGGSNPNVFGGNLAENNFSIDGVNTTDPVTHTFSFNLNFDAIQEIALQTSSYAAEYGRATGGLINVVTKSGGNQFSGSADIRYSNNNWSESGDHFNPGVSEARNTPWGVTLGGPILRDRLWFFGNLQRPDNFTTPVVPNATVAAQLPPEGPVPRKFLGWNSGGKLSFTASPQFSGFAEIQDSLATIAGSSNTALRRPEATSTQHQRTRIYTGIFDGVFSANWAGELQIGRHEEHLDSVPTSSALSQSQWTNRTGGSVVYDAFNNYQASDRNRNLLGVSTTYFFQGLGDHQLKFGGDADRTYFPSVNFTTGTPSDPSFCPAGLVCGATFTFNGFDAAGNRIPFSQQVSERKAEVERDGRSYTLYAQDQWRIIPSLSVNLGARWDRTEYYNNIGSNVLNFDRVQPRIGFAWDITGDSKTIFRGSYGQFYYDPALTFARLFDTDITTAVVRNFSWSTASQKWNFVNQTGGNFVTQALLDGKIQPTYDEQVNGAIERQVLPGTSVALGYVYKKTHNIFEDTCTDQTNCPDFWLSNQPGRDLGLHDVLRKNYWGYTLQVQWASPDRRVFVNANYVYSKSQGSIDSSSGQFAGTDFDHFPENFQNRYGYLDDDARHRVKIFASYAIPWTNTLFGVNYSYRTGLPYTTTHTDPSWGAVFTVPRGFYRTPVLNSLDMQLEQPFNLPYGVQVSIIGSVFNVVNSEQPLTYFTSVDSPSTVRTPATYQRPRNYEVGFHVSF